MFSVFLEAAQYLQADNTTYIHILYSYAFDFFIHRGSDMELLYWLTLMDTPFSRGLMASLVPYEFMTEFGCHLHLLAPTVCGEVVQEMAADYHCSLIPSIASLN